MVRGSCLCGEVRWGIDAFGSLDDDPGRGADDHIYVDFKALWYAISDSLPQFAGRPPA